MTDREVRKCAAGEEEAEGHQHDRDRPLPLLLIERRHDESPCLPQQHGQGDHDAPVQAHPDTRRQTFRRAEVEQFWVTEFLRLALAQVDVRLQQELEHLVVEGDDEHHADRDGERRSDDADAELGEMLRERHRVRARQVLVVVDRHEAAFSGDAPGVATWS